MPESAYSLFLQEHQLARNDQVFHLTTDLDGDQFLEHWFSLSSWEPDRSGQPWTVYSQRADGIVKVGSYTDDSAPYFRLDSYAVMPWQDNPRALVTFSPGGGGLGVISVHILKAGEMNVEHTEVETDGEAYSTLAQAVKTKTTPRLSFPVSSQTEVFTVHELLQIARQTTTEPASGIPAQTALPSADAPSRPLFASPKIHTVEIQPPRPDSSATHLMNAARSFPNAAIILAIIAILLATARWLGRFK